MAIVIQNLTPTNPSTPAGGSITFDVVASDDGGAPLSYVWQFSTNGVNYTSSGLSNNTSQTYNTGPLTINQNGIYYRVAISNGIQTIFSDEVINIGERSVVVYQDPSIITFVDSTVDYYPTSETKSVGEVFEITMSATLTNADISTTTLVSNINFQWQYTEDSGDNWVNIIAGGDISITNTIAPISAIPSSYLKYSTLRIQNLSFSENLNQYRVIVSYNGAVNTPVTLDPVLLLIDPVINIYRQPGIDPADTQITNCYKTSIANSGNIRISIGALTTASTTLSYDWQVNFGDGFWYSIDDIISFYTFRLKPGTTTNSDLLELERFIYYDNLGFRCVISGTAGEATVTSDEHYIYMTDVQVSPIVETTVYDIIEDRYGDIPNRESFTNDIIRYLILSIEIDISRNSGLNGNKTFTWQRKEAGSSTWTDVSTSVPTQISTSQSLTSYTLFPDNSPEELSALTLITPPLRVDTDNGSKYRVKIESSGLFSLTGNTKTLQPYYSDEITINVYRTVYITNQPATSSVFPNASSSFSVSALPSSGDTSQITYQWQYNTSNSSNGWVNIANSSPYSGANTDLVTISPVPASISFIWYRCILSISGQLSSVTSDSAQLILRRDFFVSLPTLNDVFAREYENVTFTASASSISANAVSYQWEKSTDYNQVTSSGTWNSILGETTDTLNLLSVNQSNSGFYRVKITSFGGQIAYSNVARLLVELVNITLTRDIPTNISILEGVESAYTFQCLAVSSINTDVSYQWQIKRVGDLDFSDIGTGFNNSVDTDSTYVIRALDTVVDNNAIIRCKINAVDVPGDIYTTQCNVTVIRRFTYFADVATKRVTIGSTLTLDLNPSFTGGNPSYMWQENGVDLGETQDVLVIPNIDSSYNGRVYRCRVTLDSCTQHQYSRNNVVSTVSVTPPSEFTLSITISTVTNPSLPLYYSNETAKTGAAIGTVICIPKPAGYIEDVSAVTDDIDRWRCSRTGTVDDTTARSTRTSGSAIWSANKPSWASNDYTSPKWLLSEDRFKGFIELRGQYVKALDFPELARMYGTKFGGSITGTYPSYNSNDYFRMPNTYAKRMMGTGNVNNNSGSVSLVPLYNPDGSTGGDKNVPGSMGGVYNYEKSAQLPPGSPGVTGQPDGTADGFANAATFNIGSFSSSGVGDVNAFVQPTFAGSVSYSVEDTVDSFTDLPSHNHTAVSVAWRRVQPSSGNSCFGKYDALNPGGVFRNTSPAGGSLEESTTTVSAPHNHTIDDIGPGSFDMVRDAGMNISDSTLRFTNANRSILDNNLSFFFRNNEPIPLNSAYFRLKYMIKAY